MAKKVSKGMKTRGSGRAASNARAGAATREKMISALNMSGFRGGDGAVGTKPATYGNYPPSKNVRNQARNAAYGSRTTLKKRGK